MCVSRIQRLMMAIVLGLVLFLGLTSNENFAIGLQIFVIIMLSIWAITNFCPSIWVLKKILPPCKWEKLYGKKMQKDFFLVMEI